MLNWMLLHPGSNLFLFLAVTLSALSAAISRRSWLGAVVVGIGAPLLFPKVVTLFLTPYVILLLIGLASGISGWALRHLRPRLAALGAVWAAAGINLLHLLRITAQSYNVAELVFTCSLLAVILVLGSLTVTFLPEEYPLLKPPSRSST